MTLLAIPVLATLVYLWTVAWVWWPVRIRVVR